MGKNAAAKKPALGLGLALSWVLIQGSGLAPAVFTHRFRIALGAVAIVPLVFPLLSGHLYRGSAPAAPDILADGLGLKEIDLMKGQHLLVLMSTSCRHCQETVFDLNGLAETDHLPPVLGLCTDDEAQRSHFRGLFQPTFDLYQISEDLFDDLLAGSELPRVLLVRNGLIEKTWDGEVPDPVSLQVGVCPPINRAGRFFDDRHVRRGS
jgi:hypothetical protein